MSCLAVFYSRNPRQLVRHLLYISYDNNYISSIETTKENIVPVSSNPAYGEVTMGSRNIKIKANSVCAMVHPTVPVLYYENISVGVMSVECEHNTKNNYENVHMH